MGLRRRTLLGAALTAPAAGAMAQAPFPSAPVRIIVPAPPGAFNDLLARLVAERLSPVLGQPVLVENRVGAGGSLGTRDIAQGRPDGHVIGIANTATMTINPHLFPNAGVDPLTELAPLLGCARIGLVLVVAPSLGVRDVAGLLALVRSRPGALNYGSAGSGGSAHLAFEYLKMRTGMDIVHVPYRGAAPVITAMLAGDVPIAFEGVPNLLPHIQSGALRALAVSGERRDPALPEVPTLREAGVPDYEFSIWFGFVAPAGVPAPVRERLAAEIGRIIAAPEMTERFARSGAEPWVRDAAAFSAAIRADHARWGEVIRVSGARVE